MGDFVIRQMKDFIVGQVTNRFLGQVTSQHHKFLPLPGLDRQIQALYSDLAQAGLLNPA